MAVWPLCRPDQMISNSISLLRRAVWNRRFVQMLKDWTENADVDNLRWLDQHERAPNEESPIGLILCAAADAEQVELLRLDAKSIRVSEYLTELPPVKLLQTRLHQAIEHAKEQVLRRSEREGALSSCTTKHRSSDTNARVPAGPSPSGEWCDFFP
jgi:hypothetical protein